LVGTGLSSTQAQPEEATPNFGGPYALLTDKQRELIDEFVSRIEAVAGLNLDSEEVYDNARISAKTTFQAVTHALQTTSLTGPDEQSLGNALDLVSRVESIKGEVDGAKGDMQFRVYVQLVPGAVDVLERSREFSRGADNTVYHKGYPICYRQQGGVPSLQISISQDERLADIDVDYRSSRFPAALFNGHLKSANSDIRAGGNYLRHVDRWAGLIEWWRAWFGLPLLQTAEEYGSAFTPPRKPAQGKGKIEEAVRDFLSTWLVDQKPELSMGYISDRALTCLEQFDPSDPEGNPGTTILRAQMWRDMADANAVLGPIARLENVIQGVRASRPYAAIVDQPYHNSFVLYDLPENRGKALECAVRKGVENPPETIGDSARRGKYYAARLFLNALGDNGSTLYLLWSKEKGEWKVVTFFLDPMKTEENDLPDTRNQSAIEVHHERVKGDPQLVTAAEEFLRSWLIDRDPARSVTYLGPGIYQCMNLSRTGDQPQFQSDDQAREAFRAGLEKGNGYFGALARLDKAIQASEAAHPALRIVEQPSAEAYLLAEIPNEMGDLVDCQSMVDRAAADEVHRKARAIRLEESSYGRYALQSFTFVLKEGESPAMEILWAKVDNRWLIHSFRVVTP